MKLQLSLSGKKLRNTDFTGTSDPFATVTWLSKEPGTKPTVLGRTETIQNSLNPSWTKTFLLDYELGQTMNLVVGLYDDDDGGEKDPMGSTVFEVGSILGAKGSIKAKELKKGGIIIAHVERHVEGAGELRMRLRGVKMTNTEGSGFINKSDPLFELQRKRELANVSDDDGKSSVWDTVYRSNFVKNNLSPIWSECFIDLTTLCSRNLKEKIRIAVFDYDSDGRHDFMGSTEVTVQKLLDSVVEGADGDIDGISMDNALTMKGKKGRKDVGKLVVCRASISGMEIEEDPEEEEEEPEEEPEEEEPEEEADEEEPETEAKNEIELVPIEEPPRDPNFVDYINGGCELNVCVAIDFTGSNGNPIEEGTLHHISDDSDNGYEQAIKGICSVLSKYDADQMYPVWGFGAKFDGVVRHCFQCGSDAEVEGVDGILEAYRQTFASGIIMSGPTDVTQVMQSAGARAMKVAEERQAYTILVILTDGSVSDVEATAKWLDQVQVAPLSVVIVGIGDGDFTDMAFLDEKGDNQRDIAQFVPFNEHAGNLESLTAATLNEVPGQLVEYFLSKGIQPNPRVDLAEEEIPVEPFCDEEEIDLALSFGDDEEIVVEGDPPPPLTLKAALPASRREAATFVPPTKHKIGRIRK